MHVLLATKHKLFIKQQILVDSLKNPHVGQCEQHKSPIAEGLTSRQQWNWVRRASICLRALENIIHGTAKNTIREKQKLAGCECLEP
jgi:hypothetical protein